MKVSLERGGRGKTVLFRKKGFPPKELPHHTTPHRTTPAPRTTPHHTHTTHHTTPPTNPRAGLQAAHEVRGGAAEQIGGLLPFRIAHGVYVGILVSVAVFCLVIEYVRQGAESK